MNQEYQVNDDRFKSKSIVLDMGNAFTDPSLFVDGERQNVAAGNCKITSDDGEDVKVSFKKQFMDRYPSLILGDKEHVFVQPLSGLEKFALFLPFILVLTNGALGLISALGLWIFNGKQFRKENSTKTKLVLYIIPLIAVFIVLQVIGYTIKNI